MLRSTVVLAVVLLVPRLVAAAAIVPDDFPSIQLAIDSGADSILVRSGEYPEQLTIDRPVVLEAHPTEAMGFVTLETYPVTGGLHVVTTGHGTGSLMISGLHFTGRVTLPGPGSPRFDSARFEACRIDSGIDQAGITDSGPIDLIFVRGCTIFGGVRLFCRGANLTMNSVLGGGVEINAMGINNVNGNYIRGPAEFGILTRGDDGFSVTHNRVENVGIGIATSVHVADNLVQDCSGNGIGARRADRNVVRRCGGFGIVASVHALLEGNVIDSTGAGGIHIEEEGNVVLRNVVGHTGGNGIEMQEGRATSNTLYDNAGSGLVFASLGADPTNNICYGNGRYGLEAPESVGGCNDWFANALGGASPGSLADTDLLVDPLFCGVEHGDIHLRPDSPLLDAGDCDLVGALGLGLDCPAIPAEVSGVAPRSIALSINGPNPTNGPVNLQLALPREAHVLVRVFDVQGRQVAGLCNRFLTAGTHPLRWDSAGAPSGVYFVRARSGDLEVASRLMVVR